MSGPTFTHRDALELLHRDAARAEADLDRFRAQRAGHPSVDANRAAWAPLAAVPSWSDDPLAPARGVLIGLGLGAVIVAGIAVAVWRVIVR